jgi:hypothetical protein
LVGLSEEVSAESRAGRVFEEVSAESRAGCAFGEVSTEPGTGSVRGMFCDGGLRTRMTLLVGIAPADVSLATLSADVFSVFTPHAADVQMSANP